MEYAIRELLINVNTVIETFTEDQMQIFDTEMIAVRENTSCQMLIAARDGCGNTYHLNTILDTVGITEQNSYIT